MTGVQREPTNTEIEAVLATIDHISDQINPNDGKIFGAGWEVVRDALLKLSEYELWLGLCNLESVMFSSDGGVTPIQSTLFELFHMAYEQGIE